MKIQTSFHKSAVDSKTQFIFSAHDVWLSQQKCHPGFLTFTRDFGASPQFLCDVCDHMFSLCFSFFRESFDAKKIPLLPFLTEKLHLLLFFFLLAVCPRGRCFSATVFSWSVVWFITFFCKSDPDFPSVCPIQWWWGRIAAPVSMLLF